MKKAFTIIELIFVIVILGMFAVALIPSLTATRDDAKTSRLISDSKICINDAIGSYKGRGIAPDLTTIPACVSANSNGATITVNGDDISVVGSGLDSLDGDYRMKGIAVAR